MSNKETLCQIGRILAMLDRFGDDAVIEYLNNKLAPNILMDIALETGAKIEGRGIVSALRTNYVTIETNY